MLGGRGGPPLLQRDQHFDPPVKIGLCGPHIHESISHSGGVSDEWRVVLQGAHSITRMGPRGRP